MKIKVTIFGVSGYTGEQLLRILHNHKNVEIVAVFGEKTKGKYLNELFPFIKDLPKIKISDFENFNFKKIDLIYSCLPHSNFYKIIKNLRGLNNLKIIDLSADFRLKDPLDFKNWYGKKHTSSKYLKEFTYGLSEINRDLIRNSNFIANPGCYPTSVLIPLIPLAKYGFFDDKINIIVDSKSGLSGAGKSPSESKLFTEVNENFTAYNIAGHRHYAEMKQELSLISKNIDITFVPHLIPISRGILSSIYIKGKNFDIIKINEVLSKFFKEDNFINFLNDRYIPKINDVRGTNNLNFAIFNEKRTSTLILISCIDNLIKGAAGQAVQNMNIMFGIEESEGLKILNS